MPRALPPLPSLARRGLQELGRGIQSARRRRRIPVEILADRALISRTTLYKVERGDPGVAIGIYATVLFTLGLGERLGALAASREDAVGLALEDEILPKRIHRKRNHRAQSE